MKKTIKEHLKEKFNWSEKEIEANFLARRIYLKTNQITNLNLNLESANDLRIKPSKKKYVSRGAYKLLAAFEKFNLSVKNLVALDIGSSTGGFTEILLEKKAKLVYALDVGTNQLDYKLRINNKVVSLEKTNLKQINSKMFPNKIEFVCCDVSFISLKQVFKVLNFLDKNTILITLIKPQFEAQREKILNGGFVDLKYHKQIIEDVINYSKENFNYLDIIISPLKGEKSENVEYLAYFKKN